MFVLAARSGTGPHRPVPARRRCRWPGPRWSPTGVPVPCLHAVDVGIDARLEARAPRPPGRSVGDGDPRRLAVLRRGRSVDHREDRVAFAQGVGEPLQDHGPRPLAPPEAIGRRVEGLAPPVGREDLHAREADVVLGSEEHVRPPGEGEVAAARAEALHRQVDRNEGG
jgi:hypothetical protein